MPSFSLIYLSLLICFIGSPGIYSICRQICKWVDRLSIEPDLPTLPFKPDLYPILHPLSTTFIDIISSSFEIFSQCKSVHCLTSDYQSGRFTYARFSFIGILCFSSSVDIQKILIIHFYRGHFSTCATHVWSVIDRCRCKWRGNSSEAK